MAFDELGFEERDEPDWYEPLVPQDHRACAACGLEGCVRQSCCPNVRHMHMVGGKVVHKVCSRSAMATDPLLASVVEARDVASKTLAAIDAIHASQNGSGTGAQLARVIEDVYRGRGKYPTPNDFARNLATAIMATFEIKVRA